MLVFALVLMQAAAPAQAGATPEPAAMPQPAEEAIPEEPKMKRVCRKVSDPRIPTLASRQTVCKFVPLDEAKPGKN